MAFIFKWFWHLKLVQTMLMNVNIECFSVSFIHQVLNLYAGCWWLAISFLTCLRWLRLSPSFLYCYTGLPPHTSTAFFYFFTNSSYFLGYGIIKCLPCFFNVIILSVFQYKNKPATVAIISYSQLAVVIGVQNISNHAFSLFWY